MAFENSIRVLQGFAKKQVADAKKKLKGSKHLAGDIKSKVIGDFEKEPVVQFTLPYYAGFVDVGVKGTGQKPKTKDAQPLTMKKQLTGSQGKFAELIFGYNKTPSFKKKSDGLGMIPPSAIDKWIIEKGIKGTRDARGRFISRMGLKIAIALSIHRQGLTGKGFFSIPLDKNLKAMNQNLESAYAQDIKENLIKEEYFV